MEYHITEIINVLGIKSDITNDAVISNLLTDSRKLSNPSKTIFFALKTKTNDGHNYVHNLYNDGVRNFVVSSKDVLWDNLSDANFLVVKDTMTALQKVVSHHRRKFDIL